MNNTKTTKRALLTSAFSMIICVAMLIGTTFAWFTDNASTAVNKIQAGKLSIELLDASGVSVEGRALKWKTADNRDQNQILWEPGCTYELEPVTIKNAGNLALKYKIVITGIKGSAKLNDAIDWEIKTDDTVFDFDTYHSLAAKGNANDSDKLTISGKMKPDAGNEYQGLSIDGIGITVYATQDTVEADSNDNTYDTEATYLNQDANDNYLISNANELVYFAQSVNVDGETYAGKTVKLTADIDLAGKKWIPVGQTQVSSFQGTFDGQNHTIKNMTVNYTGTNTNYACGLFGWIELHNGAPIVIQNVKFDNANVTGIKYTGVVAGYANGASGAEIKNCVVTNSTVTSNSKNAGGIIGYMGNGVLTGNTVSGCTISAKYDVGGIANSVEPAVTFRNNKVENTNIYYAEDQAYDAAGIFVCGKVSSVTIDSTNTNSNVTVNKLVAVSTASELSAALNKTYTEDTTVMLTKDITLTGEWGEHSLDGRNNANLTINGNGHTITGLNKPLVAGNAAPDITIKDLTINASSIGIAAIENGLGTAAFVSYMDANTSATFKNCHLVNSSVTGNERAAALVSFTSCSTLTIEDCSVENCEIKAVGGAGGLVGYSQNAATIKNSSVKNTSVTSTEDREGTKTPVAGGVIGTVGGTTTFTNVTATNVTVSNNNATAVYSEMIGRITGSGSITIN